jgi:hypothetical protein
LFPNYLIQFSKKTPLKFVSSNIFFIRNQPSIFQGLIAGAAFSSTSAGLRKPEFERRARLKNST